MESKLMSRVFGIGIICGVGFGFAGCTTTGALPAAEHGEVVALVNQLFEAMRMKDEAALRGAFTEQVAMTSIDPQRGVRTTVGPPDAFINGILSAQGELIERM